MALGSPAHAAPGDRQGEVELSVTSDVAWLVSDSAMVTSADQTMGLPELRLGWSPLDALDVFAGWRVVGRLERDDKGYAMTSDGDALVLGARGRYPLLPWLALVGELELEALHLDESIAVGAHHGGSDGWTFGAVPKVGIEGTLDLGGWACVLRLEGGYGFRAPLSVDGIRFASDAAEVVPVDLGTLDLSGPVFGLTLAVRL
ncbi:MAG: hypothetical protein U1F43_33245 [Myxococcota bacterium]